LIDLSYLLRTVSISFVLFLSSGIETDMFDCVDIWLKQSSLFNGGRCINFTNGHQILYKFDNI